MKHKVIDSSLKSILGVTVPMILSAMSSNLMYVIDRFMLAGYSLDAMNSVVMAGNFVCIFILMFTGIANSAEIFVGQYNGSKQYEKLAAPVWQMIYFALISYIISFPVAYFSDYINFFPDYYAKDGVIFQKILMYFGFLPPIKASLAAFFVGQGKTKIITFSVITGTALLIILDYFFIYGYKDIIPSMGSKGSAIATIVAEFVEFSIYFFIFFSKSNRKNYCIFKNIKFDKKLFGKCFKVGLPVALGNCASMFAWYIIESAVTHVSKDAATIYNIGISIYVFFIFVGDGMNKGVATICSNMIGQGNLEAIEKTRKICIKIALCVGVIIAIPLIVFPNFIINSLGILSTDIIKLYSSIRVVLMLVSISVTLETLMLSIWGILIAGGDTKYVITVLQSTLWLLVVIPLTTLFFMNILKSIPIIYVLIIAWLVIVLFFIHRRYKSLKWYNKLV